MPENQKMFRQNPLNFRTNLNFPNRRMTRKNFPNRFRDR
jgi:hypothetical protein